MKDAADFVTFVLAVCAVFGLGVVVGRGPRTSAPVVVSPWHSDSLGITCLVQRGEIKACLWDVERPAR